MEPYPPLTEYGLVSDAHSAALISRHGSVDWMCLPRFDSSAIFSRLLDWKRGGYFEMGVAEAGQVARRYVPGTNILETTFVAVGGTATLTDFMPVHPHVGPEIPNESIIRERLVRHLTCLQGSVRWRLECRPRFDYGLFVPFLALPDPRFGHAHGGANGFSLAFSEPMMLQDDTLKAEGVLDAGESVWAVLRFDPRYEPGVELATSAQVSRWRELAQRYWEVWSARAQYAGADRDAVVRSALVLKALTYEPSGALVAAPTTSLPERIGGTLNWDYRFTWLRDASFVLNALFRLAYHGEARAFMQWLDWTTVGRARDLQIVYGIGGERHLVESTLEPLEGWRGSRPVRVGNAAHSQFQLDVYGELLDAVHEGHRFTGELKADRWNFLCRVANQVCERWKEPDEGIWETRDGRRHHVHSKVMAWVALDRAIQLSRNLGLDGPVAQWEAERARVREDVLRKGWNEKRGAFVQAYGDDVLDAAVLQLPLVGFLPATDPRMTATIRRIEQDLSSAEGFVWRNEMHGPLGTEGAFVACTFWLVENLVLLGETQRARALFDRVCSCASDLGLFAEEVQPGTGALLGNFPQAFSHLGHILAAARLSAAERARPPGPADGAELGGRAAASGSCRPHESTADGARIEPDGVR